MAWCNYCKFNSIGRRAQKEGKMVTKLRCTKTSLGGVNIYVHPDNISVTDLPEEEREQYFVAWYMSLPDFCCC